MTVSTRVRRDRCPGVTRPWPADDGALVRIRLIGGRIRATQLTALSGIARAHGDGDLHLTGRANLQLRALPHDAGRLARPVYDAIERTGLLPSAAHDLVRNVMVSPLSGRRGGRADLRPVAQHLDRLLLGDARAAALPGRFLFVLDDGRGDLADRGCDLGLVVLDAERAQVRVGEGYGQVVGLDDAPRALLDLAHRFLDARGDGPTAAWHVHELGAPLVPEQETDPRALVREPPLPYDAEHVAAPGGVLGPDLAAQLGGLGGELVVTPWRGVLVPGPGWEDGRL